MVEHVNSDQDGTPSTPSSSDGDRSQPERRPARATADPSAPTLSADPASSAPMKAAQHVSSVAPIRDPDRYEILGEHGRGGLGRVSRAHDKDLGRDIAIKELLSRGHVNELRFVREAMITARLEHPGIVPVHEAGRWPDGTPFYAMKLVSGRPLRALIAERKTVDERIELLHHVIAVADAIAYAHGRNIIHRDLKPANVIVGDFGETVVIDWGLAKDLSETAELASSGGGSSGVLDDQLTSVGSVLGTPAYMAPEQERGEAVDQRADVFAIGAMLWELCSLHKVPPADVTERHRMLRRAGIDRDLAVIIDKALDPEPRGRYRDAGGIAADLKAFKSGARITARDYSLVAMLAHWTRRHRGLAGAVMAFAMLLIVSVAALAVLYRSSNQHAAAARSSADAAQRLLTQSYVDQGRRALLDDKYSEALAYLVHAAHRGDDSSAVRFMLDRAARPFSSELLRLSGRGRMWAASFSLDGKQVLTADDEGGRLWDATTGRLLVNLPAGETVFHAQFSLDQKTIATVGITGTVRLWDAQTGASLHTMTQPTGTTVMSRGTAFSPDGRLFATIGDFQAIAHVWDVRTGIEIAQVRHEATKGAALAFSRDSRWLATTCGDNVRVLDTTTWKPIALLDAKSVRSLTFDPTGSHLAIGNSTGEISMWSIPSGVRNRLLVSTGEPIGRLVFSPDGVFVAAAAVIRGGSGAVAIWRTASGELQMRSHLRRGSTALEFNSASTQLLAAGAEGQVVVLDVNSKTTVAVLEGASGLILEAHFDSTHRRVVAASMDGTVHVWQVGAPYRRWTSEPIGRDCGTDITPAEDSRYVVVGCTKHSTRVWDTAEDRLLVELPGTTQVDGPGFVSLPSVSDAGDMVAIPRGNAVELYTVPEGRLLRTVQHVAKITVVRFASTGHVLVTGSADGSLLLTREGLKTLALPSSEGAIDSAAFLPDGRVIVADDQRKLHIYDVDRPTAAQMFELPIRAQALRLSRDGRRLIVIGEASSPTNPIIVDLDHGHVVAELRGHRSQAYSAQFVGRDQQILTASTDGTAMLWDGWSGKLQQTYLGSGSMLFDAALSVDGAVVVTARGDGTLQFWDTLSGTLMWSLRAQAEILSAVHFEGTNLIVRGAMGDLSRWELPTPPASPGWLERFDRLLRCAPLRFDERTGGLVTQPPSCNVAADARP